MKRIKKILIVAIFFAPFLAWPLWAKEYGPIRPHESLVQVARKFKPKEATLGQAIISIYLANPGAFENGNPHQLKKGTVLTIPEKERFFVLSPSQASVAFFELNQKYPSPPSQKTTAPKREQKVAKSGRDAEKNIQPLKKENERDDGLMPLPAPSAASEPSTEQSPNTSPPAELPLQQPDPEKPSQVSSEETDAIPPLKSTLQDTPKTAPATPPEEEGVLSLANIAPWIGVGSILAFLLIFYLVRRQRRSEPWEDQEEETEHHLEFMHAPRKSLEDEIEEQPERADLVLRLARQYSRHHNTAGLAALIEKAQNNPALQSILPDLYRFGKVAGLETQAFKGDDAADKDSGSVSVKEETGTKQGIFEEDAGVQQNFAEGGYNPPELLQQDLPEQQEPAVLIKGSATEGSLELAKLYLQKGATKGAKAILAKLVQSGTPEEQKEANLILSNLTDS